MICSIGLHGWKYLQVNENRFYSEARYCWRCGRAELMDREDGYFSHRRGLDGRLVEFIEEINSGKYQLLGERALEIRELKQRKEKPSLKVIK